jgi:hypothetical protein
MHALPIAVVDDDRFDRHRSAEQQKYLATWQEGT